MYLNCILLLITGEQSFLTATIHPWRRRVRITLDNRGFSNGRPMVWTPNDVSISFQKAYDLCHLPSTGRTDLKVNGYPARFGDSWFSPGVPELRVGCQRVAVSKLEEAIPLLLSHQDACLAKLPAFLRPAWLWLTK